MAKKILIGKRQEKISDLDAWVGNREAIISKPVRIVDPEDKGVPVNQPKLEDKIVKRRLTIDIPDALHKKIKSSCAQNGVTMVEEIEKMLNERFMR